jgi:hypothetical protein
MKSYTDLEQSKKLAEILPLESADMKWHFWEEEIDAPKVPTFGYSKTAAEDYKKTQAVYLPCWSLTALLLVIPKRIKGYNVLRIDMDEDDFEIWYDEIGFGVNTSLPDITNESAVGACYEMILKLNELNLL